MLSALLYPYIFCLKRWLNSTNVSSGYLVFPVWEKLSLIKFLLGNMSNIPLCWHIFKDFNISSLISNMSFFGLPAKASLYRDFSHVVIFGSLWIFVIKHDNLLHVSEHSNKGNFWCFSLLGG